jgi:hypothetical protein
MAAMATGPLVQYMLGYEPETDRADAREISDTRFAPHP